MATFIHLTKLLKQTHQFNTLLSLKLTIHFSTFNTTPQSQIPENYTKTFSHIFQQCSYQKAIKPGKQAHALMITSGFKPTVFVTNCLIQMYIKGSNISYATSVFDEMPQRDNVSFNAMIFGYSKHGNMKLAKNVFDLISEKDVISWNSLISGYLQNGEFRKSVEVFLKMGREGVNYDRTTFAVLSKACASLMDYALGVQVHGIVVKIGFDLDVMTGSSIVDMYGKCKRLNDSLRFFTEMPEKNWVSWSALIASCIQNNELINGLNLFIEMQREGFGVSQSTYASVFRSCAALSEFKLGSQLHCHALKNEFGSDIIVGTATLDMYAKCENLLNARKVFDKLPKRNLQSHNALIIGYTRAYLGYEALEIFRFLLNSGLGFDEISLSGVFSACAVIKEGILGMQIHGLVFKTRFISNVCVSNAILDMYGKCGSLKNAHYVFDEMEIRDAVSFNSIITAYEQNGDDENTLLGYNQMVSSKMEPDEFTYGSVLKACAGQKDLESGTRIHNRVIKSGLGFDPFVGSALVDMYSKCNKMEDAKKLQKRLKEQTIVSWNSIISGFSLHNQSEEAQKYFIKMLENKIIPDNFTYATIIDTCANLATLELGKQIHGQIIKQDLKSDVYITSTLVDMYSKCGIMKDSRVLFEKAINKDFVTWNAIICGYSQHGFGNEALNIFEKMKKNNIKPNNATFVAVLRACAHVGIVEKGLYYFNSMKLNHGLEPQLEHYSCMVDILGRFNKVNEALKLIQEMPFEPDDVIWRSLLSICKLQGNVEVAEKAANKLVEMDGEDSSAYILLSNVYAEAGKWDEVAKMRKVMRLSGLKKEPGCSWIELMSEVHMFLVWDKAHPRCNEIYGILNFLIEEMKRVGYEYESEENSGTVSFY